MNQKMVTNRVLDGLFGLCVGDALGVPVEGSSRSWLKQHPVTEMRGYGSHNQPPGTWSDDSSLAFCLAESLCAGFDPEDIAGKFCKWMYAGYWTPFGHAFGIGGTTYKAISRLREGIPALGAGGKGEYDNGNGSLMRILPLTYYLYDLQADQQFKLTHQTSSITHAHPRSQIACNIYIQFALNLIRDQVLESAYREVKKSVLSYYWEEPYRSELSNFSRILQADISGFSEDEIDSSGYVVDTLEASLWCCLNNSTYKDTVLCAVNLGGDTDTTAAVAGGLAGLHYGFHEIPRDWVDLIARKEDIYELADRLNRTEFSK